MGLVTNENTEQIVDCKQKTLFNHKLFKSTLFNVSSSLVFALLTLV